MDILKIYGQMANIVFDRMKSYQSDFYKYNALDILKRKSREEFPLIWIVTEHSTSLIDLSNIYEKLCDEETRYRYAYDPDYFSWPLEYYGEQLSTHIYLITDEGVRELTYAQAKEAVRDYELLAAEKFKASGGKIPEKGLKAEVIFVDCEDAVKQCLDEADEYLDSSLRKCLERLKNRVRLADNHQIFLDYHPHAKQFSIREFINDQPCSVGTIVFHGWPETGYLRNGNYQDSPRYGWAIHLQNTTL